MRLSPPEFKKIGTQDLPLTWDKNGETNKIVCIQLLLNQNIRTVPQDKFFDEIWTSKKLDK